MSDVNETKYTKLFNDAVDYLDKALNEPKLSEDILTSREISDRKISMAVIGSFPRYKMAQASAAHVTLAVLEGAAENKEEYRQLIRSHMPRFAPLATIPQLVDASSKKAADLQKRNEELVANHLIELKNAHEEVAELKLENEQLKAKQSS
jgi:hypothetical protein